ncbi:SLC13 family permease [Paraburkholderia silvatlantica]|uniref:Di/tricarboxylate transporter n=1 Tax=Paraburkholderia silvatlantica TaxID=321895 RepID=A0ABR6FJ58_9BURK|nr:SLC13 family permease [Paraburkholderia silvatlantica]MBB2927470.1 di/tricarboxylate transporter [Paraburkholderia silvatlantica]PVY36183.1 di/tricarboxylate transporter [Paraburkholderia silvatlantica]PXW40401.1 di/tricarboxylate transporter [Paraburkholderia silvatlantica]
MSTDLLMTVACLACAIAMFLIGRPRADAVALIMIVALSLAGIVTVNEALAGFSDPNIVLIAALFVLGDALARTGVAQRVGDYLIERGGSNERRLVVLIMIIVGVMGSVMSSTAVVAIFIPIVVRIARQSGVSRARMLMPVSMAALTSGMLTLVATTPNLVINSALVYRGYRPFSFFAITPLGVPILAASIGWMLFARRFLSGTGGAETITRPSLNDWVTRYSLAGRAFRLEVGADSPLVGQTLGHTGLDDDPVAHVVAIERRARMGATVLPATADSSIAPGDVLLLDVESASFDVQAFCARHALAMRRMSGAYFTDQSHDVGMAEVIVPPDSSLVGNVARSSAALRRHGVTVVGLRRADAALEQDLQATQLKVGDTLLVVGPWIDIFSMQSVERDIVCLAMPVESDAYVPVPHKALHALAIMALVIAMMLTPRVPNVLAGLIGCLLMGAFGCVSLDSAYRAIHWRSLVLIVGMLPFSIALQRTGGIDMAADAVLRVAGNWGAHGLLGAVFLLTLVIGTVISGTATAVLMAPVVLAMAAHLHASPYPFAMTTAVAASAAYMSPVSTPVNALVSTAGGYRFREFFMVGSPAALGALAITVMLVPLIWPVFPR